METEEKQCFNHCVGVLVLDMEIKQEAEAPTEESEGLVTANQQFAVGMEPLQSIKTEEDPSYSVGANYAAQKFTQDPLTPNDAFEHIKTEETSDQEFLDDKNDSDEAFNAEKDDQDVPALPDTTARLFKKTEYLKNHLITHAKERKRDLSCRLCKNTFYTKAALAKHMKVNHSGCNKCHMCGACFTQKASLDFHVLRLHSDKGRYRCQFCNMNFSHMSLLSSHVTEHTGLLWECCCCEKKIDTLNKCLEHMIKFHKIADHEAANEFIKPFRVAEKSSLEKEPLQSNTETEHSHANAEVCGVLQPPSNLRKPEEKLKEKNNNLDSAPCALESQQNPLEVVAEEQTRVGVSDNQSDLRPNIYPKSQTRCERQYKCQFCLRSFKKNKYLKNHLITHSQSRKRDFACHSCEKAFYTKGCLLRHVRVHTSAKQRGNLKSHMIQFTPNPETPNNSSVYTKTEPMSDEEFLDEDAVFRALDSQHSPLKMDKKMETCELSPKIYRTNSQEHCKQTFKCELCADVFNDKIQLTRHSRIHGNNRSHCHSCGQCGRNFPYKQGLNRHLMTHVENRKREFKCQSCEKAFFTKADLLRHARLHTDETHNFGTASELKDHTCKSQRRRYKCELCCKYYFYRSGLVCEKKMNQRVRCRDHIINFHKITDMKTVQEFIRKASIA